MPSTLMLLSYPYRPDPRVKREARALLDRGIGVQLIAWDRGGDLPEKAVEEGVSVERLGPRCPYRSAGKVVTRLPWFWLKALAAARSKRFDVVHSHDFDTLPLGLLISRLTGKPMLYDAHEIYSDMIEKDVGRISRAVWRAEKRLSRSACELVTVNEALAQRLSVRGRRARVVTNSPDTSVLAGTDLAKVREKYGLRGFIVSYLGSLEPGRFVPELDPHNSPRVERGG